MNLYFKIIGYVFLYIIILTFILTISHYFNLINKKWLDIIKIIIPSVSLLIGGYRLGYRSKCRGWLEGIKLALVIILIFLLVIVIFQLPFSLKNLLYYTIILFSSMLGSMIGISRKPKESNS
ncbi:MAG: TIGR04086 family membrane protein [Bacilli bacterium]|jgi:putative membrane protein (TIGR04086 family)|nr:TIGR04086 family membrane protein [Bacilli bacterium]